ncbi:MAG: hypothetical protein JWQ43_3877 [Glaciihabitans sp.]|nr:hypothetical protein [Glaciihabitans sp.]
MIATGATERKVNRLKQCRITIYAYRFNTVLRVYPPHDTYI